MKALEEKRRVRNQRTRHVCFHGSNKYTNGSHGKILLVYSMLYWLLKCDMIEETLVAPRK